LVYLLDVGPHEQAIIKQAVRMGNPIPDRIANAPKLEHGLEIYLQAFFDLDTERNRGNGICPIPWSSVSDYARAFEFDAEQTEDLHYFIRKLDQENMKRLANKTGS